MKSYSQNGITITGHFEDSREQFVTLKYQPRMRGNLNFDSFRSVGTYIRTDGSFTIKASSISHSAKYGLEFPGNHIPMNLFEGDSIFLEICMADIGQTFATGVGAGKINILNLKQFQYDYFDQEKERDLTQFVNYINNVIQEKQDILTAIYQKKLDDPLIKEDADIVKIINRTPITDEEYNFLQILIDFQRYNLQADFLSRMSYGGKNDTVEIDFMSDDFKHFDKQKYKDLHSINDWSLYNSIERILQVEFLRFRQANEGLNINYGNWETILNNPEYHDWVSEFLNENFSQEIYNRYYAEYLGCTMTWGLDQALYLKYLDLEKQNKYTNRLNGFKNLLERGIKNEKYKLDNPDKMLDEGKFKGLLKKYENSKLLIVFWSAQAAGASLIGNLPAMREFEENYQGSINIIYICIDKSENRNKWAARIIDESWNSKHYFLPLEGNENALKLCTDQDVASMCNGGAAYTYIDSKGNSNDKIRPPFNLTRNEIKTEYK